MAASFEPFLQCLWPGAKTCAAQPRGAGGREPCSAAAAPPSPAETAKTAAAVGELNLLASLIGGGHAAQETFKLENLFGHDIFTKEGPGQSAGQVIEIYGSAKEHRVVLDSIQRDLEVPAPPPPPPEDGDLLDLMDSA